jgi:hypothetical protein
LGLLVDLTPSSAKVAAPTSLAMPMSMSHDSGCDRHPLAPTHEPQSCATLCCAVLPSLPHLDLHPLVVLEPSLAKLEPLVGEGPGLDPPPPRGG